MDPLEREIAILRARASLADSERRRFKEEKKWALSQGNLTRATQMSWQVKRYTALTQSFTKEADARLLEVTAIRAARLAQKRQQSETPLPAPQHAERQSRQHTNHTREATASTSYQMVAERDSNAGATRHRKQSSGNLKSAMRTTAR